MGCSYIKGVLWDISDSWLFHFNCFGIRVLCLFLAVPWVGLWSGVVAFPCQTRLLFNILETVHSQDPRLVQSIQLDFIFSWKQVTLKYLSY